MTTQGDSDILPKKELPLSLGPLTLLELGETVHSD